MSRPSFFRKFKSISPGPFDTTHDLRAAKQQRFRHQDHSDSSTYPTVNHQLFLSSSLQKPNALNLPAAHLKSSTSSPGRDSNSTNHQTNSLGESHHNQPQTNDDQHKLNSHCSASSSSSTSWSSTLSHNSHSSRSSPPLTPSPTIDHNHSHFLQPSSSTPSPLHAIPDPVIQSKNFRIKSPIESPIDPAIQRRQEFIVRNGRGRDKDGPLFRKEEFTHESKKPTSHDNRGAPTGVSRSRGICRGCQQEIVGKSIKAADCRLTGRYHKECFVCHDCRRPFATASFYVLEDQPYCEQHYHQRNNSLCGSCNLGIEGQYIETLLPLKKFHPSCFKCQSCNMVLREEYFEVGETRYCYHHAVEEMKRTASLPGRRRYPERRTTRLML